jgi:hypothetical protein
MASFTEATRRTIHATHDIIVTVAKREHAKVMSTAPRPMSFKRFVDGAPGRPEEAVKPNGVILYQYPRLDLVAEFALETLRRLSPVGPPEGGHYRDSHQLFVNGQAVESLHNLKPGDKIVISNTMPYARKIEVGSMKMSVPPQVYERAVRLTRQRFGTIAEVLFTYRGFVGGAIHKGAKASQRYPAMLISER